MHAGEDGVSLFTLGEVEICQGAYSFYTAVHHGPQGETSPRRGGQDIHHWPKLEVGLEPSKPVTTEVSDMR